MNLLPESRSCGQEYVSASLEKIYLYVNIQEQRQAASSYPLTGVIENFQVETISRSIVPTIVDLEIEIDIIIILIKDSPNYALGWHVGNSA